MKHSWATPGVKCVCINGRWRDRKSGKRDDPPSGGPIFTVVSVCAIDGIVFIGLWGDVLDHWWAVDGFRPLVTRTEEQDIATFLEIARQAQTPVGADT
jgi:hypothetical protein